MAWTLVNFVSFGSERSVDSLFVDNFQTRITMASSTSSESANLSKLLVPMMAKIQDAFEMTGGLGSEVALPSIVAVGSQSAGKSSVRV